MPQQPLISIVIPCYNYGAYVEEAVQSCLDSTFQDFEILVVNDGSTDSFTLEVLARLDSPQVRVIHQPNGGLPAARNRGFSEARAPYVLPLDADDTIHPTLMEKAYWVLQTHPEVAFVSFWLRHFGDEDWIWRPEVPTLLRLLEENCVTVTSLVRKDAWRDAGGYDERMRLGYEDWNFWISLVKRGLNGMQIPEPLFQYRRHGRTMLHGSRERHAEIMLQFAQNHPELFGPLSRPQLALKLIHGRHSLKARVIRKLKKFGKPLIPHPIRARIRARLQPPVKPVPRGYDAILVPGNAPGRFPFTFGAHRSKEPSRKPIRLLYLMPWMEVGGADRVNLDLLRSLDPETYALTVVTTSPSENPWQEEFAAITSDIIHLPHLFGDFAARAQHYAEALIKLIASRQINLLQISNSHEGFALLPAIREFAPDLPILSLIHNFVPEDAWDHARNAAKFDQAINAHVAITPSLRHALIDALGLSAEKVHVIGNGVDETLFPLEGGGAEALRRELGLPRDAEVVTFIGRMLPEKNPARFVRLAARLTERDPAGRRRFVMVGDGPQFDAIAAEVKRLGLTERIVLLGVRDDIPRILSLTDVLLAPSQREGLPIVGLEAMASRVPIVASRVVGWIDLIQDGVEGYLLDLTDENGFLERVETLLEDVALRERFGTAARRKVLDRYTLRANADAYQALHARLIAESHAHAER